MIELKRRAGAADRTVFDEGATTCCYAKSEKHWVTDPQGIAWEHYQTFEDNQSFGQRRDLVSQQVQGWCEKAVDRVGLTKSKNACC
ncbi:hypothetical protein D9M68_1001610 [compost metagenome]